MARKPWHFFINSFEIATRGSYKKALSLGASHLAQLSANQGDPVIAALLASFTPVWEAYKLADLNLRSTLGNYKGDTQRVRELFTFLNTTKLPYWEPRIWMHHPRSEPESVALLPRGRRAFQKGAYVQRIQAIKALGKQCEEISDLQLLSVDILAFHAEIEAARVAQLTNGRAKTANLRTVLEAARLALCAELYGNMGGLMQHYRNNPEHCARYFKLRLVRKKGQKKKGKKPDEEPKSDEQ